MAKKMPKSAKARADGPAPKTSARGSRRGSALKTAPPPKASGEQNTPSSNSNRNNGNTRTEAPKREPGVAEMTTGMQARERRRGEYSIACRQQPRAASGIDMYNIQLSTKRLEERGFHPAVTTKTRDEVLKDWAATLRKYIDRPTRQTFLNGGGGFQGVVVSQSRDLTRALLVFRHSFIQGRSDTDRQGAATGNGLAFVLNAVDIGGQVAECIFADGYKAVHNTALTSTQSWSALAQSVVEQKVWDFFAGDFCAEGPGRVFTVVAPEYTIGEFRQAETYDPCGLDADNPLGSWCLETMKLETEIYVSIDTLHRRLGKDRRCQPNLAPVTDELVAYARQLGDVKSIHGSNQFKSGPPSQVFDPSAYFVVTRLRLMSKSQPFTDPPTTEANIMAVNKIFEQRAGIKVLYFQKTPHLDRRILAVILRACPRVEMIGIYDCPLIHFGDVLCLLDLIHEINLKRREGNLPVIKALDFFPRYHEGMPYQHPWAETYGLTWGPQKLDIVQRGFFCIVLKAFMKAKAMNLDLLFSKGNAFCHFLFKVPNYSLAVPSFLDAMYRLVDLQRAKKGSIDDERKQVTYDLLKPVRIDLEENISHDWPHWYCNIMGRYLFFCSSCGYEMLEEFFTAAARDSQPHTRVCAGCLLQLTLDEEGDHLKKKKTATLTKLFPAWHWNCFNHDAPLSAAARGIISLKSTVSERPDPPGIIVNSEGDLVRPPFERPLVRDNKVHSDSLQNLPSLADLVEDPEVAKLWTTVNHQTNNLDMYSRLVRRLREENQHVRGHGLAFENTRFDGGMPDHVEERQPPRVLQQFRLSHSFSNVVKLETMVYNNGWL
ncbi:Uncharacterized protein TCAP_05534 [Tolypocladium capitatum]|uniref:Uncharacterized protein n=1 Tax=Tolypocladium capitatum TaxID=45235 RepID=A0A2K3QAL4_9HYPO|nr:Uncharacterized protein TCAP_05534 [Tolypocladium capitatum]